MKYILFNLISLISRAFGSPTPNERVSPVIIENRVPTPTPAPTPAPVPTSNSTKPAAVAQDSIGAAQSANVQAPVTSHEECMVCCEMPSDTLFLPCYHLAICSLCSPRIKKCLICRSDVTSKITVKICIILFPYLIRCFERVSAEMSEFSVVEKYC